MEEHNFGIEEKKEPGNLGVKRLDLRGSVKKIDLSSVGEDKLRAITGTRRKTRERDCSVVLYVTSLEGKDIVTEKIYIVTNVQWMWFRTASIN